MPKNIHPKALIARSTEWSEALEKLGYKPLMVEPDYLISNGADLNVFVHFGTLDIAFAIRSRFDRWTNSRDYLFDGIPSLDHLPLVVRMAENCFRKGMTRNENWTPLDLNQFWRQAKREIRSEAEPAPES